MLILYNAFDKNMFLFLLMNPLSDDVPINVPSICVPPHLTHFIHIIKFYTYNKTDNKCI